MNSISPEFNGRIIRNVSIELLDIFESPSNSIYSAANSLKIKTDPEVVKRELLFDTGDNYDDFIIRESLRNLRTLGYLRDATIIPTAVGKDEVDILVRLQETWTLIPQLSYSSGSGNDKRSIGLAESNLLGRGKRLEVLFQEDDNRESIAAVYDARRFFGHNVDVLAAVFDRNDGEELILEAERPFRTLLDTHSWKTSFRNADTVGRLFADGDERYIYRREGLSAEARITRATGDPRKKVRRYSLGYRFVSDDFTQATLKDYDLLDLDPEVVSNDPALLAKNRRFSGPIFAFESVESNFLAIDYIDRFGRVTDYNLGTTYAGSAHLSSEYLGGKEHFLISSLSRSGGVLLDEKEFLRGEIALSTRLGEHGFENSLFRSEARYYNVLGLVEAFDGTVPLGQHTLAAAFTLDIGSRLDLDRELLAGGDNFLRGYKARTFTGNKRYAINLEDRIHLAEDVLDLLDFGLAFFADVGGSASGSVKNLIEDHSYADIGVGLRIGFPRSSGERVLRIEMAFPLRDGPDGSGTFEPRFLVSGAQLFSGLLGTELRGAERATAEIGFDK